MTIPAQSFTGPVSQPPVTFIPHCYIIVRNSQRCQCCNKVHEWSATYAQMDIKPVWGQGKQILNWRAVTRPEFNLPIIQRQGKEALIPFCHDCYYPSLLDLPDPPKAEPGRVIGSIQAASEAKVIPLKREAPTPRAGTKVKLSVDAMFDLIG